MDDWAVVFESLRADQRSNPGSEWLVYRFQFQRMGNSGWCSSQSQVNVRRREFSGLLDSICADYIGGRVRDPEQDALSAYLDLVGKDDRGAGCSRHNLRDDAAVGGD